MRPLQQRIAAVTDTTTYLIAQLRELDRLRELVKKAELSFRRRGVVPTAEKERARPLSSSALK